MKDIYNIDQYSLLLNDDSLINHLGCHSTSNKDALFPLKVSKSKFLLLPAPEFSALLYRGQNEYFEICKPTLLRQMSIKEKLTAILQKIEFISALKTHPLITISKMSKKTITSKLKANKFLITDNNYSFNISKIDEFNKNVQNIINDLENRISQRGIVGI